MAGCPSKFVSSVSWLKKMLRPLKPINTKIHEITGKNVFTGNVPNPPEGPKPNPPYRQVGKSPQDRSGYKVQHLGDKK